jgi:hypothetical protein
VAVVQLHAVVVMTAVKRSVEGVDADTFRFPGIAVRFFDLPNHARIHTFPAPFIRCKSRVSLVS